MIKKITFLTILLLLITGYFLPIVHIQAAEEPGYKIEVSVPGGATKGTPVTLTQYVRYIYLVGLSAIGIAALGVLVYAGFMYMMAGTVTSKDEAKKRIWGALSGLVLALAAFLILYTINPDLVSLKAPTLEKITLPEIPGFTSSPCESDSNCDTSQCQICAGNYCISKCHSQCQTCKAGTCVNKATGTACKGGTRVCKKGKCITCETEGGWCSYDTCCPGLICDTNFTPDRCVEP